MPQPIINLDDLEFQQRAALAAGPATHFRKFCTSAETLDYRDGE